MKLLGQENIIKYFENAMENNMLHHCYLVHGKRGIGKKTLAKELAKLILCGNWDCGCRTCTNIEAGNHPDVSFFYSEDKIVKLETVDEFKKAAIYSPLEGSKKIVVLGGVDRLNSQGANKILTLIEEPPPYLTIILLCENITNVIRTIRSRAVPIKVKGLSRDEIERFLVANHEVGQADAKLIANFSEGSIGEALYLKEIDFLNIREKVCELLWESSKKGTDYVKIEKNLAGIEPEIILDLIEYWLRDLLYLKMGENKHILINKDYYDKLISVKIQNIEELLNKVKIIRNTLKNSINVMLNLEVIFNSLQEE